MHLDATTKAEYAAAMEELGRHPIVGTNTVGELTIECSMRTWALSDGRANRWSGSARTADGLRRGVWKAFRAWMANKHF